MKQCYTLTERWQRRLLENISVVMETVKVCHMQYSKDHGGHSSHSMCPFCVMILTLFSIIIDL